MPQVLISFYRAIRILPKKVLLNDLKDVIYKVYLHKKGIPE